MRVLIRSRKFWGIAALSSVVFATALAIYAARAIERVGDEVVRNSVEEITPTKVALVLGCSPQLSNGQTNLFFRERMAAAAKLYASGRVQYLLVSGDNHKATYDEPTAMKEALLKLNVPAERIVLDYAGFSTYESIVRARWVFGLDTFCIVSQRDHASRAAYIAKAQGIRAEGFAAVDVPLGSGTRTKVREVFARVRTLLDVHVWKRKPRFLGPKVEIGGKPESENRKPESTAGKPWIREPDIWAA